MPEQVLARQTQKLQRPHPLCVTRHSTQPPEIHGPLHRMAEITRVLSDMCLLIKQSTLSSYQPNLQYRVQAGRCCLSIVLHTFSGVNLGLQGKGSTHLLLFAQLCSLPHNNQLMYVYPLSYKFQV